MEREINALLVKNLQSLEEKHLNGDLTYEVEKHKQDQRRLLRMLEKTSEYEYFSKFAMIDDGIEFLRHPNQSKKSSFDAENQKSKKNIHFCSCNK